MTQTATLGPDVVAGLVDAAPDALLVLDPRGRVRYANRQLETLSGWSRGELLGRTVENLMPERFRSRHVQLRDAFVAAPRQRGMGVGRVLDLQRRDGSFVPVEIGLSPGEAEGEPVVLVAVRDVSDRLRAEARERLVGQALDAVDDGVVLVDAGTGERVYVNRAAVERSGYTVEELQDVPIGAPSTAAEEAALQSGIRDVVAGGRRVVLDLHQRRRDGGLVPVEVAVSYLPPAPGDPAGHVVFLTRDVTARIAAEGRRARRAAVAQLVADVATHVLGGQPVAVVHQEVADGVALVFDAESVTVGSLTGGTARTGPRQFVPAAAHGPGRAALAAALASGRASARALGRHERVLLPPLPAGAGPGREGHPLGPGAAVRFGAAADGSGVLAACRPPGGEPFTDDDVALLATLAQQVALAVELGRAHAAQERLAVLEDRERLARDLHDTVVQDIIATGIQVAVVLPRVTDPDLRSRLEDTVDRLEGAVRQLRGAVFELHEPARGRPLVDALEAVAGSAGRVLGHQPEVVASGPVDRVTPEQADQLVATLQEALSNVLRHAHASTTRVRLAVAGHGVTLTVEDDGVGPPPHAARGDGLSNLQCRARSLGGWSLLAARHPHGARFVWHVPLAGRPPSGR